MSRPFFSFGGGFFYSRGVSFFPRPPPLFSPRRPPLPVSAHSCAFSPVSAPAPAISGGFLPAFRGFPAHFAQRAMLICDRFCSFVIDFAQNAQPTRRGRLSWGGPRAGFSLTVFPRASRERGKRFSQCGGKRFPQCLPSPAPRGDPPAPIPPPSPFPARPDAQKPWRKSRTIASGGGFPVRRRRRRISPKISGGISAKKRIPRLTLSSRIC